MGDCRDTQLGTLQEEFAGAELGDARLQYRLTRIAEAAMAAPAASLPEQAGSEASLESTYRFLNNEHVTHDAILAPHIAQTVRRSEVAEEVLCIHDTSFMEFGGEVMRRGLGPTAGGQKGFLSHTTLCVARHGLLPLGVIANRNWVRTGLKGKRSNAERMKDETNESLRWAEQAIAVGQRLGKVRRIHVADRETDDYKFWDALTVADERFVLRMAHDRPLAEGGTLYETLGRWETVVERQVQLSPRKKSKGKKGASINPPRKSRLARLRVTAGTCTVLRSRCAVKAKTRSLKLNFVLVEEVDAPPGEKPVTWRLVTTEPTDTPEAILAVVDIYRARWNIEDFFKALKTGCSFEKRQLESYHALTCLLAILLSVAWRLLLLRRIAEQNPDAPAQTVLSVRQVQVLRALHTHTQGGKLLPTVLSVQNAMMAIAAIGGHQRNNGSPGWQTLGRGFHRLLEVELGWILASEETARPATQSQKR